MKYDLLILWLLPLSLKAQQPSTFLKKAMLANGQWEQLDAFSFRAARSTYNPWQSYAFDQPKAQKDVYEVHFDPKNKHFQNHEVNHYPGGYLFDFISIARDSTYYIYDVTKARIGNSLLNLGKDQYTASYQEQLSYFPYYVLKEILDSRDSLQLTYIKQEVLIQRILKRGIQKIWLNAQTGTLNKYSRKEGNNTITWHFEDYTNVKGYRVPRNVKQVFSNQKVVTDHLVSFDIGEIRDAGLFNLPIGYREEALSAAGALEAKEIKKGIFLVEKVDGDRNVIFINMDDGIFLTEAPVSEEITNSIIQLIRKTLPGKRIKYVHLSHFHRDHIAGISKLVEEGATIICTPVMEKPLRNILEGMSPKFLFFNGKKTITDHSHRLDFFEVPNSHVQGLSFLYLPNELMIYEGDLLSMPEDGTITPAILVYKEFYSFLKQQRLSYKRIIGHHGLSDISPLMFKKTRFAPQKKM